MISQATTTSHRVRPQPAPIAWAPLVALVALLALAWAGPAPAQTDPAGANQPVNEQRARQQLNDVLDQPAFEQWRRRQRRAQARSEHKTNGDLIPDAWQQWWNEQRNALQHWLDDLFANQPNQSNPTSNQPASRNTAGGIAMSEVLEVVGWVLLVGVGAFVLVALARLIVGMERRDKSTGVTRKRLREAMDRGEALAAESPQWLAEADQLAEEHDLRRAYRALYLALLAGLHRDQRIDFRPNRTNWMYVRQYRGQTQARQTLAQLTEQFDAVWYGRRPPHHHAMQRARQQVRALLKPTQNAEAESR